MSIRPEDFSSDIAPPRPTGIECEYNLQKTRGVEYGNANYVSDSRLTAIGVAHHGSFLGSEDGSGRLYTDVGHIELATGEAMGPASAAVEDIDGIDRIARIVDDPDHPHDGLYRLAGTYIQNGAVSNSLARTSAGRSSGYHENYLMPSAVSRSRLLGRLLPTMLATNVGAMNGTLRQSKFVLSQKVWSIGEDPVSRNLERRTTHGKKPMIIIPPTAVDSDTIGDSDWARAEVRLANPGLSLTGRYLGIASVSLTLRLIEQQHIFDRSLLHNISLADPVRAAKLFASDMSMTQTAERIDGKQVTMLDVQEKFLDLFAVLMEKVALPADEQLAVSALRGVIDGLRASKPAEAIYAPIVLRHTDFAPRHRFVSRNSKGDAIDPSSEFAMQRNLLWDRVSPDGPGRNYWARVTDKDPLAAQVRSMAVASGGLSGRAKRRAAMIDNDTGETVINWAKYRTRTGRVLSFGSPYGD